MVSNWKEELVEAKKSLLACERLLYVGLTVLKDNRILARTVRELARAAIGTIKAYVGYFAEKNEKVPNSNFSENLKIFLKKIAPKYISPEDIENIIKLLTTAKIHKGSSMEFVRREQLVMYYNGKYETINKEKVFEYSKAIKRLINSFPAEKP